jgi:FkbM family methyltransferase
MVWTRPVQQDTTAGTSVRRGFEVALKRFILHSARHLGLEVARYPRSLPAYQHVRLMDKHGVNFVVDVGANVGQYAGQIRQFGYRGEILSLEPLSEAYDRLRREAGRDERWYAEQSAIGRSPGEAEINIAGNSASSSLLPMLDRHVNAVPSSRYVGTETVRVRRLDDVLDRYQTDGKRIFLKVDTQGFEREVLAGLGERIDDLTGLQLEMSLVPLYAGQMLVEETMRWAAEAGLRLASVEPGVRDPESGELLQMDGVFVRD